VPEIAVDRRRFLQGAGLATAGLLAAACSSHPQASGDPRTIKIGFISPQTGSLAGFSAASPFVLDGIRTYFRQRGVTVAGTRHGVSIVTRDTQSSDNLQTTAELTADLITTEQPDLILAAGHGRTVIPVSSVCERLGCPCISTMAPWQVWLSGQTGNKWIYHFNWGRNDLISTFADMWRQIPADKVVGEWLGNDKEGIPLASPSGFPATIKAMGYKRVDPGRFTDATTDFSPEIAQYKSGKAEILAGTGDPGTFLIFWQQAHRQGYTPKLVTLAEAIVFPADVAPLGELLNNLSCEVWWHPTFPFSSSLTGQSAARYAASYTAATGKQWTQSLGYVHAIFEIAVAALTRARRLDRDGIAASIGSLTLDTIAGPVSWRSGPVKNVATTPLTGGQWRKTPGQEPELVIVANQGQLGIPLGGTLRPLT
jgi:branched-chain amino acid transport system substrate-binding protein